MAWTNMPLGATQNFDTISLDYAMSMLSIPRGLSEEDFWLYTPLTISTELQVCTSVGTLDDSGGMGNSGSIMSVEATLTEMTNDLQFRPVNPGNDIEYNTRLMYLSEPCLLFTQTEKTYSITGRGDCPVPETAQNALLSDYVSVPFATAHGTFTITPDAAARINSGPRTTINRDSPHEWGIEALAKVANGSPTSDNILTLPAEVEALVPSGMRGIYVQSLSMSEGKSSRATESWTLTLYHTS